VNVVLRRFLRPRTLVIAIFAAIAVSLVAPFAVAADAPTPAETFVQQNVQKGLAILNDKGVANAATAANFRAFLESLTDIKRIALYTLGPAAKTAAPADLDAFIAAFQDYATAVYQAQLSRYSGQSLVVTGSMQHAPGDFIVRTHVADASGRIEPNGSEVDFRVVAAGGSFQILDASIEGIWIADNEREQFMAFLAQHGGSVPALTAHVKEVTAGMAR
jgi:phospholipid transport system substrate-binding protein